MTENICLFCKHTIPSDDGCGFVRTSVGNVHCVCWLCKTYEERRKELEAAKQVMCCQHEGCTDSGPLVECYLPDTDTGSEHDYLICPAHCHAEGFCYLCGGFFAGIEAFDFAKDGMCDNCRSQGDYDDDDDDPYEPDYDDDDNYDANDGTEGSG